MPIDGEFISLQRVIEMTLPKVFPSAIFGKIDVKRYLDVDLICLDLLNSYFDLDSHHLYPSQSSNILLSKNAYRARHTIIMSMIGFYLGRFDNLMASIGQETFKKWRDRLWIYTVMVHDYGYFCKEMMSAPDLESIQKPYLLLSDDVTNQALNIISNFSLDYPEFFTYTYEDIKKYYSYSIDYHQRNGESSDGERADHGIIGSCIVFRRYCQKLEKSDWITVNRSRYKNNYNYYEPAIIKAACLTAASHNVYKSESEKDDEFYRKFGLDFLCHDSSFVIARDNPLLLLLSIVDTIECCKRFSRQSNSLSYLLTETVLSKTLIKVSDKQIEVDYTPLANHLRKRSSVLIEVLNWHVDNVLNLKNWTCLKAKKTGDYSVKIAM